MVTEHQIFEYVFVGLGITDPILLLNRLAVGLFFLISGYHKLFVKARHEQMVLTLQACGIPFVGICCWFIPTVEFLGGIAVSLGILAPLAALPMLAILVVALITDGPRRIREFQPIDMADVFDDLLYLSETTYAIMLLAVIFIGPGKYSLHVWLLPWAHAILGI